MTPMNSRALALSVLSAGGLVFAGLVYHANRQPRYSLLERDSWGPYRLNLRTGTVEHCVARMKPEPARHICIGGPPSDP
jgi:hypothetical protein